MNPTPIDANAEGEAVDLIRALCPVAGDHDAVLEVMRDYRATHGLDGMLSCAAIALLVTYSRCLPGPVPLPEAPASPHPKENHR